jgi:DinB superfamily
MHVPRLVYTHSFYAYPRQENVSVDDRLQILLDQLDAVWNMLDARLTGRRMEDGDYEGEPGHLETTLTDEEYFWEPAPDCGSLRRRVDTRGLDLWGKGEWVLDGGHPASNPPPFTTIAWRMCHICESPLMRYDYTFGTHSLTGDQVVWPSTARDAFAFLTEIHVRWRRALEGISSEELDQVGRSQNPYGSDPENRFAELLAWTNIEFTHHAGEIACLRDPYHWTHAVE